MDAVDPLTHLSQMLDVKLAGYGEKISYEVASLRQLIVNQQVQFNDHESRMRANERSIADMAVDRTKLLALGEDMTEIKATLAAELKATRSVHERGMEKMDGRVSVLEEWRWKVIGSGVLAGGVTAGLVSAVLQAVNK